MAVAISHAVLNRCRNDSFLDVYSLKIFMLVFFEAQILSNSSKLNESLSKAR